LKSVYPMKYSRIFLVWCLWGSSSIPNERNFFQQLGMSLLPRHAELVPNKLLVQLILRMQLSQEIAVLFARRWEAVFAEVYKTENWTADTLYFSYVYVHFSFTNF
jgi:hypothetical protein